MGKGLFDVSFEDEDTLTITVPDIGRIRILTVLGDTMHLERLPLEVNEVIHQEILKADDFTESTYWEDRIAGYCKRFLAARMFLDPTSEFYHLGPAKVMALVQDFLHYSLPMFQRLQALGKAPESRGWGDIFARGEHDAEVPELLDKECHDHLQIWANAREISLDTLEKDIRELAVQMQSDMRG